VARLSTHLNSKLLPQAWYTSVVLLVSNKKARHLYQITQTLQAGLVLTGSEVKSLRRGAGSLTGSFVKPVGEELFLLNAQISPYPFAKNDDYDPLRNRKLLIKKKELYRLIEASSAKGMTLVPLSLDLVQNRIKLTVGVGKGQKEFEKRVILKNRAIDRSLARRVKQQQNAR
jgi:SsrA-binding protein